MEKNKAESRPREWWWLRDGRADGDTLSWEGERHMYLHIVKPRKYNSTHLS